METHGTTREEQLTMMSIQSINQKMPDLDLRDLFAMQAMNSLIIGASRKSMENVYLYDISKMSYEIADAMIKARRL